MTDITTNNANLGKTIIEIAKEKRNEKKQEAVIATVEALMNQIEGQDALSKQHGSNRDFYKRRLKAIEDGAFDLVESNWQRIKYHEDELNRQDM